MRLNMSYKENRKVGDLDPSTKVTSTYGGRQQLPLPPGSPIGSPNPESIETPSRRFSVDSGLGSSISDPNPPLRSPTPTEDAGDLGGGFEVAD
ncbi:hypothetical protein CDL15_Pgr026803 [Punica granatum]|uniref:Uncharacterized protein n=1 Tax=Punica granatum TaxID=22663 RepID=A0A218WMJ2_PUNGR|nr:hypothetical protein CDL15_Pgr026803 [Punica granatum]